MSALAPPGLLAKGCANVIQLDKFKDEAGPRWPRICEGVYGRLEHLLRDMLSSADFFARIGETAYLVVMPTTEPEDVNVTCMRVAFDLHVSFLGQCGLEQVEVATARANPSDEGLLLEKLPAERIVALAEKAGIQFSTPAPAISSEHRPVQSGSAGPNQSPSRLGQFLATPVETKFTIEHHFIPFWSVQHSAVTTYLCEAKSVCAPNRRDTVPLHMLTPNERLQVEMSCFQTGLAALDAAMSSGRPFLFAAGFSFDSIGSPAGRKEFLSACHDLSHELRQYLAFIVYEIPLGVGQTRLATAVTLLKPFGRVVWATVAPQCKNLTPYQGIGLTSIGYDLREFGRLGAVGQHHLEALSLFARRNNLLTFLNSVHKINTLKLAQDAGINHLSGDAIAPAREKPEGMWRLSWDKVMSGSGVEIWM